MKYKYLIVVCIFCCSYFIRKCGAQAPSLEIGVKSDNHDNDFDYTTNLINNINYNTGTFAPNFPITQISGRSIELSAVLNYTGGKGIKVNEMATEVGLGFELQAGGYIKRVVRGVPDENFNKGRLFGYNDETDIYYYNLNGIKGKIIYGDRLFTIPASEIEIDRQIQGYTQSDWTLTLNGTKYIFYSNDPNFTDRVVETSENGTGTPDIISYIHRWNLSKIITPEGDEILFTYQSFSPYQIQITNKAQRWWIRTAENHTSFIPDMDAVREMTLNTTYDYESPKKIKSITTFSGRMEFNYLTNFRTDLPGQPYLNSLETFLNGNVTSISSTRFKYDHFISVSDNTSRLKLTEIEKYGYLSTIAEQKIKFDYNPLRLPAVNSFCQDLWGFYNSNASSTLIPQVIVPTFQTSTGTTVDQVYSGADRRPDENRTQACLLNRIIFSTGSYVEIAYEQNSYFDNVLNLNQPYGGVRVKSLVVKEIDSNLEYYNLECTYNNKDDPAKSSGGISAEFNYDRLFDYQIIPERWQEGGWSPDYTCMLRSGFPYRQRSLDELVYEAVRIKNEGNGFRLIEYTGFSSNPDVAPERHILENGNLTPVSTFATNSPNEFNTDKSNERSLIKSVSFFNESNDIIRKTINSYQFQPTGHSSINQRLQVEYIYFHGVIYAGNEIYYEEIREGEKHISTYTIVSAWAHLTKTETMDYFTNGNISTRTIDMEYNSLHSSPIRKQILNSDGTKLIQLFKYVYDVGAYPNISTTDPLTSSLKLLHRNYQNNLVEELALVNKCDGCPTEIIEGRLQTFKVITGLNGVLLCVPSIDKKLNSQGINLSTFAMGYLNSTHDFIFDSRYQDEKFYDLYNSSGKLTQYHVQNGNYVSIQFDNLQRQVASYINARTSGIEQGNECSFIGFETGSIVNRAEENDFWSIDNGSLNTSDIHSGGKSFYLDPSSNSIGLQREFIPSNQYQKFVFSAWIKSSSDYGSGGNQGSIYVVIKHNDGSIIYDGSDPISYNYGMEIPVTNNEWKYTQFILDLGQIKSQYNLHNEALRLICNISNSDPSHGFLIDDVCFKPLTSKFEGRNYSSTNNQIESNLDQYLKPTFFEYDHLNRPTITRNFRREILKVIEYNPASTIYPAISSTPEQILQGESTTFKYDQSLFVKEVTPLWTINDPHSTSNSSSDETFDHIFAQDGIYDVNLKLTDQLGYSNDITIHYEVAKTISSSISGNFNPTPNFHCKADETYILTFDGGFAPYTFEWYLDNYRTLNNTTEEAHFFIDSGNHEVKCILRDASGHSIETIETVHVPTCP